MTDILTTLEESQMSKRTALNLTAGFLLSLALGACAANDPAEVRSFAAGDPIAAADHADHSAHARSKAGGTKPASPTTTTSPPAKSKDSGGNAAKQPAPEPPTAPDRKLHFATPEAAMRYLADAYNRKDIVALKHVTNDSARQNLEAMRSMAENLRLVDCKANPGVGDYLCAFVHDYPASLHKTGHGAAHFTVAPVDSVGWYMTVLDDCS